MSAKPWMKFYPQDWRADEKLRMCSLAARGLWMEMLAIMHRSERYGQLLISGHVPTDAQLAVQVGASPSEVTALLAELDGVGVFSRAANGAIYSRRMTRDHKKAKTARENGKNGGNPSLCKGDENSTLDKGKDKAPVKGGVKPQRPEARDPEEEEDKSSSSAGYVFEGRVIRLRSADFERWRSAYHAIPDLRSALNALDEWLADQPAEKKKRWFHTVSGSLDRKHQEALKSSSGETELDILMRQADRYKRQAA